MRLVELNDKAKERVSGMVELRRIVNELIEYQLEDYPDDMIQAKQAELNAAYDAFTAKNGLINNRANSQAFADDSSYYLLCSLENLDEDGHLKSKADMFTKRTIKPERKVNSVDTPSEALAISIGEHGKGWTYRVDKPSSDNAKPHVHVDNNKKNIHGVENVDGTPSHGKTLDGSKVPKDVQKKVKDSKDYKKGQKDLKKMQEPKREIHRRKLNLSVNKDLLIAAGIFVTAVGVAFVAPEFLPALLAAV